MVVSVTLRQLSLVPGEEYDLVDEFAPGLAVGTNLEEPFLTALELFNQKQAAS